MRDSAARLLGLQIASAILCVACFCLTVDQGSETGSAGVGQRLFSALGINGGIIVHVGCGTGELTKEFGPGSTFRVHGVDVNSEKIERARIMLREANLYGNISVDQFDGTHLPYSLNLVNAIIVSNPQSCPDLTADEARRVLVPGGALVLSGKPTGNGWEGLTWETIAGFDDWYVARKPRISALDEWTHFLHEPDNNAVSRDSRVSIPRSMQWVSGPRWGRSHEELASMSAAVTANGKIFYIVDEAPLASIRFLSDWKLVARDAFNGILLWKRDIPVWNDHLRHFRSGPVHLPRRLVAIDDTVYMTSGFAGPVVALDAATGKQLKEYTDTEYTEEILLQENTLFLVMGSSELDRRGGGLYERGEPKPTDIRAIAAIDIGTGKLCWKQNCKAEGILPLTLAVKGKHVYYQSTTGIVCLAARDGAEIWRAPRPTPRRRMSFSAPTLVATDEVVLCADRDTGTKDQDKPSDGAIEWGVHGWNEPGFARKSPSTLKAYSANDGRELWSTPCREGYNSPVDLFVINGAVWVGPDFRGFDLKTGEQVGKIDMKAPRVGMPHHRCYRDKASENFIFMGKSGIEVLDIATQKWLSNNSWIRGTCQYGIIPANGLLYAPPDACACFLTVKSPGFFAAAPEREDEKQILKQHPTLRVEGPQFGKVTASWRSESEKNLDWPMYRHDSRRSGATNGSLPEFPKPKWTAQVGGRLTQPVIADGNVVVASCDTHSIHAFAVAGGQSLWTYTAGARIDSSPTLFHGMVLFGCRDGWIYCLDIQNGNVVWKHRIAPASRLVSAYGQLESAWPVHGAVLIQNKVLYAISGRSTYLDGGLVLHRIDPFTGKSLSKTSLYHLDPETGQQLVPEGGFNMEGTTSDILSGDGSNVFLKYFTFDADGSRIKNRDHRLFAITGLLGEEWFVRSYWILGLEIGAGWGGWANAANRYPAGRILCFDDRMVYGYGRETVASGATGHRADTYHLFGMNPAEIKESVGRKGKKTFTKPLPLWADTHSLRARALVLGKGRLAVAGPIETTRKDPKKLAYVDDAEAKAGFDGERGILLRIVRTSDGKRISETSLPSMPVFDGMSAADGQLFIALKDGSLQCFQAGEGTPLPDPPPPPPATPKISPQAQGTSSPPTKLTGPDKKADFTHVDAKGVVASPLGYRVAAEKGKIAIVLKELDKPATQKLVLKTKMVRASEYKFPHVFENAFLAFGNGTADAQLVKCGIKIVINTACIITGTTKGAVAKSAKITLDKSKPIDVTVTVDLAAKEVQMKTGGSLLKASLPPSLTSVTHVGYVTLNAVSDFSPIEIEME